MLVADFWPWVPGFLNVLMLILGVFLILLVLIQRGKGGGLAGAFGGVGGSSAFGSRAGDLFTRITIGVAAVWLCLIMFTVYVMQEGAKGGKQGTGVGSNAPSEPSPGSPVLPP